MSKRASVVQTVIFCVFIAGFFILNIVIPDSNFSEQENRYLSQLPRFSISNLADGRYTGDFENYVMDQFAFRDSWTALKARSELALGKQENRNVYFCEDGVLIEHFEKPDYTLVDKNIAAVNSLTDNVGIPVYLALIPGAAEIWRNRLPENAPNYSQVELMTYIYEGSGAVPVDIYGGLKDHAQEYIFYRTDHHWTTLGAYYGYLSLSEKLGFSPTPLSDMNRQAVSEEFYGAIYSASGFSWVKPDTMEVFVQPEDSVEVMNFPTLGTSVEGKIYEESFLDKKDKYSMFLGGNTPQIKINTGNEGERLLILRDSFMDSLTPFLLAHYYEIHILDLRYYLPSVRNYIQDNAIDTILVCYSVKNFSTDSNVFLAGR